MKPLDSLRFLGPVGKCHPATESTWVRFGLSGTPLSLDMCEQIRVKAISASVVAIQNEPLSSGNAANLMAKNKRETFSTQQRQALTLNQGCQKIGQCLLGSDS